MWQGRGVGEGGLRHFKFKESGGSNINALSRYCPLRQKKKIKKNDIKKNVPVFEQICTYIN